VDLAVLVMAFALIVAGAELFTNGIEWFGHMLELGEGAVGSVFAAVGTALPETMIPVIAIVFGSGGASHEIGVGAVLGAPFMLGTLAMAIAGAVVLLAARRRSTGERLEVSPSVIAHDVRAFAVAYLAAVGLALLPSGVDLPRLAGAVALVGGYLWYAKGHLAAEAEEGTGRPEPLRLHRLDRRQHRLDPHTPHLRIVLAQVVVALAVVVFGATLFVDAVEAVGGRMGIDELLLALLVAPIATELPEAINAVIWLRQGKDTLAVGNITGAMVFQATIPTSVALAFAPATWVLSPATRIAFASVPVVFLSVGLLVLPLLRGGRLSARRLLAGGVLYAGYLAVAVASAAGALVVA
jgi:cation:H+ antiporter